MLCSPGCKLTSEVLLDTPIDDVRRLDLVLAAMLHTKVRGT